LNKCGGARLEGNWRVRIQKPQRREGKEKDQKNQKEKTVVGPCCRKRRVGRNGNKRRTAELTLLLTVRPSVRTEVRDDAVPANIM